MIINMSILLCRSVDSKNLRLLFKIIKIIIIRLRNDLLSAKKCSFRKLDRSWDICRVFVGELRGKLWVGKMKCYL